MDLPTTSASPTPTPSAPGNGERCFGTGDPLYEEYHDTEWGRPVREENAVFERIVLEAFQSGLSWLTILRKRPTFRTAFAGFDPHIIAGYGPADVERLLGDAGIVRNRAKIAAAITCARATVELHRQGLSLTDLVWSAAPAAPHPRPRSMADVPASTPESAQLAARLKQAGFVFVGPTTAYAAMQACGVVNDHLVTCRVGDLVGNLVGDVVVNEAVNEAGAPGGPALGE